jgi:hypothetical protein
MLMPFPFRPPEVRMSDPPDNSEPVVFAPPTRYVTFLWTVLAAVQAGLFILWRSPWYGSAVFDARSWVVWIGFDLFLIAGVTHATRFRARALPDALEYLAWNFRWVRWEWEDIMRVDRWSGAFGPRYRVRANGGAFHFSRVSLEGAARLADLVVERADLDDVGEVPMSLQAGARHIWLHPSAADEE